MEAILITSENDAVALKAAYYAGYADATPLLHPDARDSSSVEPIERIHARYFGCVGQEYLTAEARAYMAGFGDAAADNLPHPSQEFAPKPQRIAA
jgi:hypothetical protein